MGYGGTGKAILAFLLKDFKRKHKIHIFNRSPIDIKDYKIPKIGVYAVKVSFKNKWKLKGIANIGYRPTFNQKKLILEVNIFNFSGNLYNKNLSIEFIEFIRGEKKFNGVLNLKKQIKIDCKKARTILSNE